MHKPIWSYQKEIKEDRESTGHQNHVRIFHNEKTDENIKGTLLKGYWNTGKVVEIKLKVKKTVKVIFRQDFSPLQYYILEIIWMKMDLRESGRRTRKKSSAASSWVRNEMLADLH